MGISGGQDPENNLRPIPREWMCHSLPEFISSPLNRRTQPRTAFESLLNFKRDLHYDIAAQRSFEQTTWLCESIYNCESFFLIQKYQITAYFKDKCKREAKEHRGCFLFPYPTAGKLGWIAWGRGGRAGGAASTAADQGKYVDMVMHQDDYPVSILVE